MDNKEGPLSAEAEAAAQASLDRVWEQAVRQSKEGDTMGKDALRNQGQLPLSSGPRRTGGTGMNIHIRLIPLYALVFAVGCAIGNVVGRLT